MTATREGSRDETSASLQIEDLHLWYGAHHALKNINLVVARGEFVALLGPSGCGKTSLLRSIAGFAHPQQGHIKLNGRNVGELAPRARNIGLVFQNYALFPHMAVSENVRFGLECRHLSASEIAERTNRALALVGLSAFTERRPKQLSGGQQQRVALARAIVIEPDILLLDEPLGALDKQLRVQMQTELKALQQRLGVTAVFVTHDHEEAMSMADRIAVMHDGEIEQIDAPERLFASPRTPWVCEFIGSGNVLTGCVIRNAAGKARLDAAPGCTFPLEAREVVDGETRTLFLRADRVRLAPASGGEGVPIIGRRYLGIHVEVVIACGNATLRALLPAADAAGFPVGGRVTATADQADCRLLS